MGGVKPSSPTKSPVPDPGSPPKRKISQALQPDTPNIPRVYQCISYTHGNLQQRRVALLNGLPAQVPQLPLGVFIDHLLPAIKFSATELEKVYRALTPKLYDPRLRKWPLLGDSGKEIKDFKNFYKLQGDIVEKAQGLYREKGRIVTVEFASDGNQHLATNWNLPHDTRPDGVVVLKNSKTVNPLHWLNTCRADEYKVAGTDRDKFDDIRKVLWSMHTILHQDISRRFIFGLTIEKQSVRLYFACRAFLVVSEEFDLCEKWQDFVRITLAFGFASEEDLGWDTTIVMGGHDHPSTIRVKDRTYTILSILSDNRAASILGRATRVFEVQDIQTKETAVIKDIWADDSRDREHVIQENIIRELEANGDGKWKDSFFTHLDHEDVLISGGTTDSTEAMSQNSRGEKLDFMVCEKVFTLLPLPQPSAPPPGVGHTPSHHTSAPVIHGMEASINVRTSGLSQERLRSPLPRTHYRLVIKEQATPLINELQTNACLVIVLQLVKLVFALAGISWIHRDLSVTNVYSYKGMLKLGDLEYAKKFGLVDETARHDVKTGTQWFWSAEVEDERYLFLQREKNPEIRHWEGGVENDLARPGLEHLLEGDEREPLPAYDTLYPQGAGTANRGTEPPQIRFKHNPLHELESTWWILLYIFSMREVLLHQPTWDRSAQKAQLDLAFPALVATKRTSFLAFNGFLESLIKSFDPTLRPCHNHLEKLRTSLVDAFQAAEATLPERVEAEVWLPGGKLQRAFVQSIRYLYTYSWPPMLQWRELPEATDEDKGPALKRRKVRSMGDLPKAGPSRLPPPVPATTSGVVNPGVRSSARLKSQTRKQSK